MPARVLFLGADALDRDLVLRWAGDGTLPVFRRLLANAAWGSTENPPGLYVGAVWPSFWTCVSPAHHTRYCHEQLRPGTYRFDKIFPHDLEGRPFWDAISSAGRRVAIIDVPKTHVSKNLNGWHVVDWGTHDADYDGPVTWPETLAADLVAKYGRDEIGNCNVHGRAEDHAGLRDQLLARIARKEQLIIDALDAGPWDAMIAVFSDPHCVGHQCWHLHDVTHPRYDADLAARIGNPIRDVYVAIDTAIGRIIEHAGEGTEVIVLGSHGTRSHYDATFMLDKILQRIEKPDRVPVSTARSTSTAARMWMRLPRGVRQLLSPFKAAGKAKLDTSPLAGRRYFAIPNNDVHGAIRLNIAGREPSGRVTRDQMDAVCKSLERDLLALVNVDTGEPVVRRVWRVDEVYQGPNMDRLPDLIVEWNRDAPISRVHSEKTGMIDGSYRKSRTGDHSEEGFFLVAGPGAVVGPVSRSVSIMDFGPTIAERLGVSLDGVEGRSFADLVFARENRLDSA
jgi:predicted AlkP superfamily phosphohydrolase/phosphomutase